MVITRSDGWRRKKERERKARDKKKIRKISQSSERKGTTLDFFFFPPFCNFYHYLGGEVGERL